MQRRRRRRWERHPHPAAAIVGSCTQLSILRASVGGSPDSTPGSRQGAPPVSRHEIPQVGTGSRDVIPHPDTSRNSPWERRRVVAGWVLLALHAHCRPSGGPDGSGDGQEEFGRGGSGGVARTRRRADRSRRSRTASTSIARQCAGTRRRWPRWAWSTVARRPASRCGNSGSRSCSPRFDGRLRQVTWPQIEAHQEPSHDSQALIVDAVGRSLPTPPPKATTCSYWNRTTA